MSPASPQTSTAATEAKRLPLVLVADDNLDNRMLCVDYLKARGFRLAEACNGHEAVALAIQLDPDAILMDVHMPELDGLEAMRRIRAQAALTTTPIVALTALAMAQDRVDCMAAGATAYLSKPVSLRALVQLLMQLISGQSAV
ncbi:MAG: response regulator [Chloroflexales bacterium]